MSTNCLVSSTDWKVSSLSTALTIKKNPEKIKVNLVVFLKILFLSCLSSEVNRCHNLCGQGRKNGAKLGITLWKMRIFGCFIFKSRFWNIKADLFCLKHAKSFAHTYLELFRWFASLIRWNQFKIRLQNIEVKM